MARKFIKRYMPDVHVIRNHKHLQIFGTLLHDPNLWHLNRHSVSTAFAIGVFWAFMPMPFQMLPSALFAILLRANLPISVTLVWITNPFTMPPLYYFCYIVGAWVLQTPPKPFTFEPTLAWLSMQITHDWQPFLLGCLIAGATLSALAYATMRGFWRWQVVRSWQARKDRRLAAKQKNP